MTNAERVLKDVGNIVRDYEDGRVSAELAVKKINEFSKDGCYHCAFKKQDCLRNDEMTCFNGFSQWLRGEA